MVSADVGLSRQLTERLTCYLVMVCNDFSRYASLFFMQHKPQMTEYFTQFLADISPYAVKAVRHTSVLMRAPTLSGGIS